MPPKTQPKVFILLLKTHKLTVLITIPSTSTVDALKTEALEALQSCVLDAPNPRIDAMDEDMSEWTVPKVASLDDFELAKAIKEKGRPTEKYETLDGSTQLKGTLVNWEPVFVQFKDTDSGKLLPVKVLSPPVYPEEEEAPSNDKGKRKAVE